MLAYRLQSREVNARTWQCPYYATGTLHKTKGGFGEHNLTIYSETSLIRAPWD